MRCSVVSSVVVIYLFIFPSSIIVGEFLECEIDVSIFVDVSTNNCWDPLSIISWVTHLVYNMTIDTE